MSLSRRGFLKGSGVALGLLAASCVPALLHVKPVQKPVSAEFSTPSKKLKLLFFFGPHATIEDEQAVEKHVVKFKPHVYVLEVAGADEYKANFIEGVYTKDNSPELKFLNPRNAKEHEILRRHKLRVHVVERFSEARFKHFKQSDLIQDLRLKSAYRAFSSGLPMYTLETFEKYINMWAADSVEREKMVNQAVAHLLSTLEAKYPELKSEKEIRALVRYGTVHTPIFTSAKKAGIDSRRVIQKPHYFSPVGVYARRSSFGLEPKSSKEEIARTFLAHCLLGFALEAGASNSNSAAYANLASQRISLRDFKQMSKYLGSSTSPQETAWRGAFSRIGVNVPRTKEEVHSFLRKRRIPLAPG